MSRWAAMWTTLSTAVALVGLVGASGTVRAGEPAMAEQTALAQSGSTSSPSALTHPAGRMVDELGRDVMAYLADSTLSDEQRIAKFRGMLTQHLETEVIGQFVLGRAWRSTQGKQRKDYLEAFDGYIVGRYATMLAKGWKPRAFAVTKVQTHQSGDVLVFVTVDKPGQKSISAIFRMRDRSDRYKVVDVIVEGVSLLVAQRNEFATVLRDHGGVDGLVAMLKERTY